MTKRSLANEGSVPKKLKSRMAAQEFREALQTDGKNTALSDFLAVLKDKEVSDGAIQEYLECGGSCLELLQLWELDSECSAMLVLEIVQHLIIAVIQRHSHLQHVTLEACRYLLNTHLTLINKMLNLSSAANERLVVLQLLATMVSFSASLVKDILLNVHFHVNLLAKHMDDLALSVRLAYIDFIMAFFVDGHYPTIMQLMNKPFMYTCVMPGLKYDPAETVQVCLMTLKSCFIDNASVSKPVRVKFFTNMVVKGLVRLYDWRGPHCMEEKRQRSMDGETDAAEKQVIAEMAHGLLLSLCTSIKHGIIFRDETLGTGSQHRNPMMFNIVEMIFNDDGYSALQQELVVKMCVECPDLVKSVWGKLLPTLAPRPTTKWIRAVRFLQQLVGAIEPQCTMHAAKQMRPRQYAQIIQMLVAPSLVLEQIILTNFEYDSDVVRLEVVKVIHVILKAVQRFLSLVNQIIPGTFHQTVRKLASHLLQRNMPSAELLVMNWLIIPEVNANKGLASYDRLEYMSEVIHILQLYYEQCPGLVTNLKLSGVSNLLNMELGVGEDDDRVHNFMVSLVQLLIQLEPTLLSVDGDVFPCALKILSKGLRTRSQNLDRADAHRCICSLLSLTGLFNACEHEVAIWADALKHKIVPAFLCDILSTTLQSMKALSKQFAALRMSSGCSDYDDEDMILYTLPTKPYTTMKDIKPMKHITFSYVTGAALQQEISKEKVKKHLGNVILHIFHLQTDYKSFQDLVRLHPANLPANVRDYILNWPDIPLQESLQEVPPYLQSLLETSAALFQLCNVDLNSDLSSTLVEIVKKHASCMLDLIYCNPKVLHCFQSENSESSVFPSQCVSFLTDISEHLREEGVDLHSYLMPYQRCLYNWINKLVTKEDKVISLPNTKNAVDQLARVVNVFELNSESCISLLDTIAARQSADFLNGRKPNQFYFVLVVILHNFNKLREQQMGQNAYKDIKLLLLILSELNEANADTAELAVVMRTYFEQVTHQVIEDGVGKYFLSVVRKQEYCKENTQLVITMFKMMQMHGSRCLYIVFEQNVETICQKKGLILPLLDIVQFDDPSDDLAARTFAMLMPILRKTLLKPSKAGQHMENHYRGFCSLLMKYASIDVVAPYLEKAYKGDTTEVFLAAIWKAMFTKYFTEVTDVNLENQANNAVLTFVHYLVSAFKTYQRKHGNTENAPDLQKLEEVAELFGQVIPRLPRNVSLETTRSNENFKTFCRLCLKYGVGATHIYFLKLLTFICGIVEFTLEETKELLEMLCGHSEFMNVALTAPSEAKLAVFDFMHVLCRAQPGTMERKYVPLLLAAYTASVHPSDRRVLLLLQIFEAEREQTQFYDFKPFLWGITAGNFYSVRAGKQCALRRQPRTSDVLDILQMCTIQATIVHFPLKTPLTGGPICLGLHCTLSTKVYDVGFLLAVFTQLLSPEHALSTHRFTRSGALSLVVVSLSSQVSHVRESACHVLAKFFYHLEVRRAGKDQPLWLRFIEVVAKAAGGVEDTKLNSFAALFMARTALVLANPTDPMYAPLSNFIGVRSSPNLARIPELYTFLHSAGLDHLTHRRFILQILHDGMRTEEDVTLAINTMAFKLIMALFGSTICDVRSAEQILEILARAVSFPSAARTLCHTHGLSTWLYNVLKSCSDPALIFSASKIYEELSFNWVPNRQ